MLQEDLGAAIIGRRVDAADLDGAGEAQPVLHRRCCEAVVLVADRQARPHAGIGQHHVIAALGLERHRRSELLGQAMRPGAGGDHQAIERHLAGVGEQRDRFVGIEAKAAHPAPQDRAAVARYLCGKHLDETERVHRMPVVGEEQAAPVVR